MYQHQCDNDVTLLPHDVEAAVLTLEMFDTEPGQTGGLFNDRQLWLY